MTDAAARALQLAELGRAQARADRMAEARASLAEAVALEPTAGRLHDLGTLLIQMGEPAEAEPPLRQALALAPGDPRIRSSLGISLLAQGRLAEGFATHDAWREIPDSPVPPAPDLGGPLWSGEDLAGRNVLVWSEEGFGDQIMYARFIPLLKQAGAQVIWACHPALLRLAQAGLGVDAVAVQPGEMAIEGLDFVVPTSRLPAVFMQRLETPPPAPYLAAPAPLTAPGRSLGVVARGNPAHGNDHRRSLSADAAAELMSLPGAVSLAPEDTGARDFWDTAAIIAGLERVITVDTSVAHLAGALGKPVWVLLPASGCDWRWGVGRQDSPWYPTMRLFRQSTPGGWSGVLAAVRQELATFQA